jgi:hypothetical protein
MECEEGTVNAGDTGFLVHFFKDQGAEFTFRSRYSLGLHVSAREWFDSENHLS